MIVNFSPQTLDEELAQNVTCILETVMGSVPLSRSFGLESTAIDLPINFLKSQLTNKIITALQELEPRVIVDSVAYESGEDGEVKPIVNYHPAEGVTI